MVRVHDEKVGSNNKKHNENRKNAKITKKEQSRSTFYLIGHLQVRKSTEKITEKITG